LPNLLHAVDGALTAGEERAVDFVEMTSPTKVSKG
jgi:hypothetical protein